MKDIVSKRLSIRLVAALIICLSLFSVGVVVAQQKGAVAGTIEISEQYESPQKLAWGKNQLWVSNQNNETIYAVNPTNGQVTNSLDTGLDSPYGIEVNGSQMWVVTRDFDTDSPAIHEFNIRTGTEINTIPVPGKRPAGVAYDGQNLWITGEGNRGYVNLYQINASTGEMISSIKSTDQGSRSGLAWGSGFLWGMNQEKILQIDPSTPGGESVKDIDTPYFVPTGIAWDGKYLWQSEGSNHTVSRINPGVLGEKNSPPNPSFTYSPAQPTVNQQISFDASSSTDSNGFVKEYQWDFDGDGISDAQGEQATYSFSSRGKKSITLKITDDRDVSRNIVKNITVVANAETATPVRQSQVDSSENNEQITETSVNVQSHSGTTASADNTKSNDMKESSVSNSSTTSAENGSIEEENQQKERGFLTNGDGFDPLRFMTNPVVVTVAGFVVSVLGILLQLLRGR